MKTVTNEKIVNAVAELLELRRLVDACDTEIDKNKAVIIKELAKIGNNKVLVGNYKVTLSNIERTDINTEALKEDAPDVYNKASTVSTYMRFMIK